MYSYFFYSFIREIRKYQIRVNVCGCVSLADFKPCEFICMFLLIISQSDRYIISGGEITLSHFSFYSFPVILARFYRLVNFS